jgi:hypothetical protein
LVPRSRGGRTTDRRAKAACTFCCALANRDARG